MPRATLVCRTAYGLCLFFVSTLIAHAESSTPNTSSFLYELSKEARQTGHVDEAIHDLHELLLIDPTHEQARRDLSALESLHSSRRELVMEETLAQLTGSPMPSTTTSSAPVLAQDQVRARPTAEAARSSGVVRIPNPQVNGIEWFYVFGPSGRPAFGALKDPQVIYVEVPKATGGPVLIQVLDADIRGHYDEIDGVSNTSTTFRVYGGTQLLASQTVGPEAKDGTVLEFGPFPLEQGESQGNRAVFRVEAEGVQGDDNNLFAIQVVPPSATAFSFNPAIRLAEREKARMEFFPEVPAGTTRVVESNYDLDPDGGQIELLAPARPGQKPVSSHIRGSGSGTWVSTNVTVPLGTDGARWTYRITKATEPRGNMSFRLDDQDMKPLRVYFTPSGQTPLPPAPLPRPKPVACNAFEFDASQSYDPDKQPLTFRWDFGDGATGEGIRTQHAYAQAGDFPVVLTVRDSTSTDCCESKTRTALHVNMPPKAALEAPAKSCVSSTVHLSAAGSTDSPGDQLSFSWNFGDGTTGQGADVTHTYARGGAYQVRVLVDDNQKTSCSTDTALATIRVNTPPVAKANEAITFCTRNPAEPLTVALNGSGSTDADHDALTYRWDFGDGATGDGMQVSHTYPKGGQYMASLTVNDGSGGTCTVDSAAVPLRLNHAPVTAPGPQTMSCPGQDVTLDAAPKTSDPDGDALMYRWDLGDGQHGTGATVTHQYATSGSYRATLTVDDGSGMDCGTASATWAVAVNAPPVPKIAIRREGGQEVNSPTPPTQ